MGVLEHGQSFTERLSCRLGLTLVHRRGVELEVETSCHGLDLCFLDFVERAYYLEGTELMGDPLHFDLADRSAVDLVSDERVGIVRDLDLVWGGGRLETGRGVDGATDDGVVEPILGTEVPDGAVTGIDTDADVQIGGTDLRLPFFPKAVDTVPHGDGHTYTRQRVFLSSPSLRIAEEDHDPVTDELVDSAAMLVSDLRHSLR